MILKGHVIDKLKQLPAESVDCVITSPPYWGLRDYKLPPTVWDADDQGCEHEWLTVIKPKAGGYAEDSTVRNNASAATKREDTASSFCSKCQGWRGQLGLEPDFRSYCRHIVQVMHEVKRVLKSGGSLYLNLGSDTYSGSNAGRNADGTVAANMAKYPGQAEAIPSSNLGPLQKETGLPPKSMLGIPERIMLAMLDDGWILRSKPIWVKRNRMPESANDRYTRCYESFYFFTKSGDYWFDMVAALEPYTKPMNRWGGNKLVARGTAKWDEGTGQEIYRDRNMRPDKNGRHPGDIWEVKPEEMSRDELIRLAYESAGRATVDLFDAPTEAYEGSHFACVDVETEALTPEGWKGIGSLPKTCFIAAFDGKELVWERAAFQRFDYDGEMVVAQSRDISMMLTPNHRVVCRHYKTKSPWKVRRADSLRAADEIPTAAPFKKEEESGSLDNGFASAFSELCGWILTDGGYNQGKTITLYQTAGRGKHERIESLFASLSIEPRVYKRHRHGKLELSYSFGGYLARRIRELFPNKEGNYSVLIQWPDHQLKALWEGMTEGDGNRRPDARISFAGNSIKVDFYQALSERLGMTCRVSFKSGNGWQAFVSKKKSVSFRGTKGKGGVLTKEHYNGVVWCPSVPSGMWLARRHGRPFITGNTFPEGLIEKPMVASCPAEVCVKCGKARERIIESNVLLKADLPKDHPQYRPRRDYAPTNPENPHTTAGENEWGGKTSSRYGASIKTIGWTSCSCNEPIKVPGLKVQIADPENFLNRPGYRPGIILDPFSGSGTTAAVAKRLQRSSISIELNPDYIQLIKQRLDFGHDTLDASIQWIEL